MKDTRSAAQIREHYEIEKAIAGALRSSSAAERRTSYTDAYDELFRRVPHHPLLHNESQTENAARIRREVGTLLPFVNPETVCAEIGPGDCAVAFELAGLVRKIYAIDVSRIVTAAPATPDNFELIISDGVSVPVPAESLDLVYSNQLMEHLHPDDSSEQLRAIFAALKPGGRYYCVTPNRLSGPHDISRSFDDEATCLHLREFTFAELDRFFRAVGFKRTYAVLTWGKSAVRLPVLPFRIAESLVGVLPHRVRKMVTFNKVVRFLLGVRMIGEK